MGWSVVAIDDSSTVGWLVGASVNMLQSKTGRFVFFSLGAAVCGTLNGALVDVG